MIDAKAISLRDRFYRHFTPVPDAGCWLWVSSTNNMGYGQIWDGHKKPIGAHRASWKIHRGPIPDGLHVLHKCDTPLCVNPDHLFVGTPADNAEDKVAKGRHPVGEGHPFAKMSASKAMAIFSATGTQRAIAALFGVPQSQVCAIKRRKIWAQATKRLADGGVNG